MPITYEAARSAGLIRTAEQVNREWVDQFRRAMLSASTNSTAPALACIPKPLYSWIAERHPETTYFINQATHDAGIQDAIIFRGMPVVYRIPLEEFIFFERIEDYFPEMQRLDRADALRTCPRCGTVGGGIDQRVAREWTFHRNSTASACHPDDLIPQNSPITAGHCPACNHTWVLVI